MGSTSVELQQSQHFLGKTVDIPKNMPSPYEIYSITSVFWFVLHYYYYDNLNYFKELVKNIFDFGFTFLYSYWVSHFHKWLYFSLSIYHKSLLKVCFLFYLSFFFPFNSLYLQHTHTKKNWKRKSIISVNQNEEDGIITIKH